MLCVRGMTHSHLTPVIPQLGRRNALLVALAIPLVIAHCAEEGARLREDSVRPQSSNDPSTETTTNQEEPAE